MSKFKVGDKVKVIESGIIDGRKVRIIENITNTKNKQLIGLLYSNDYYDENELELVESVDNLPEMVNHPQHYNQGKYEAIDVIEDWKLNFNLGSAIKYIARCDYKDNKKEDLEKAKWYIDRELQRL